MKSNQWPITFRVLLFFSSLSIVLRYLVAVRWGYPTNVVLFWACIVTMSASILYQILESDRFSLNERAVLLEIFLFMLALRLVITIPIGDGLYRGESYIELLVSKFIMDQGWPTPFTLSELRAYHYAQWPAVHVLNVVFSKLAGLDLIVTAKWFPPVYTSFLVYLMFLLAKELYGDKRIALLAAFGGSSFWSFITFHPTLNREGLAFLFIPLILYGYIASYKRDDQRLFFILLLFTGVVVIAQNLSTFIVITFMLVLVFGGWVSGHFHKPGFFEGFAFTRRSFTYLGFLIVVSFSYWMYIGRLPLDIIVSSLKEIFIRPTLFGLPPSESLASTRLQMIYYGKWFFALSFGLVALYMVIKGGSRRRLINLLILVILVAGFTGSQLAKIVWGESSYRFQVFVFPFAVMPVADAVIHSGKKLLGLLILAFVVFNVSIIDPYVYDPKAEPEYDANGFRRFPVLQEYKAIIWLQIQGRVAGGGATIDDVSRCYRRDGIYWDERLFGGNLTEIDNYDWLFFRREMFKGTGLAGYREGRTVTIKVPYEVYEEFNTHLSLFKVYDNGEVDIFAISKLRS